MIIPMYFMHVVSLTRVVFVFLNIVSKLCLNVWSSFIFLQKSFCSVLGFFKILVEILDHGSFCSIRSSLMLL